MAVLLTEAEKSDGAERVQEQVKRLQEMKYPVMLRKHPGEPRAWHDKERAELVRWIDTLDRL